MFKKRIGKGLAKRKQSNFISKRLCDPGARKFHAARTRFTQHKTKRADCRVNETTRKKYQIWNY